MRSRGNTAKSASGMRWYESTFLASALSRDSTSPRELQPVYGTFISSRYATTFASQIETSSNASTRLKAICGFQSAIAWRSGPRSPPIPSTCTSWPSARSAWTTS
jgi:hypothetical protein